MLSPKTKALILDIFLELIQGETIIEQKRLQLNNTPNFDPFILFTSLDKSHSNSLSDKTFLSYINDHKSLSIKLNHIKFFIQFYDSTSSKTINYTEFLNIVLCNSFSKIHKSTFIPNSNTSKLKISKDIFNNFTSILIAEIDLIKRIDMKLSDLKSSGNFSLAELLKCLGSENSVVITFNNCLNFFYREGKIIYKEDICKLMKRLDIKRNGIIDMWDLEQIFYSPFSSPPSNVIIGMPSAFNSIATYKEGTITLLVNELDGKKKQKELKSHCVSENGLILKKKQIKQLSKDNVLKNNFVIKNGKNNSLKHKQNKESLYLSTIDYNEMKNIDGSNKYKNDNSVKEINGNSNKIENESEEIKNKYLNISKSFTPEQQTPIIIYKSERGNNNNRNYNVKNTEPISTREKNIKSLLNLNINNNFHNKNLRKIQTQTNSQGSNFRKFNECLIKRHNNINNNYMSMSSRNIQPIHKISITEKTQNLFRSRNIPNGTINQQPFTHIIKKEPQFTYCSPPKHNFIITSLKKENPFYKQELFTEDVFLIFLTILLDIETLIEKKKIVQLTSLLDFNIEGIFSLFERPSSIHSNNISLSPSDFQYGLTCVLNIPVNDSDIHLLLSKYDLDNVGGLSYSNFFDMLVPFERLNRNNVEKRKTNYNITQRTLLNLKDFFLFVIEAEQKIEKFRNKVQQMYNYKYLIENIFNKEIDKEKQGKVNNVQLNQYLQYKAKELTNKQTHLLFIRLDRDRDGYVSVNDILNELVPQKYLNKCI